MAFHGFDSTAPSTLHRPVSTGDRVVAIEGGRIVTPTGTIEGGTILLDGDRIDRVRPETAPLADRVIDASDRLVIPGIIDLHGDDYEHQLVPRRGAYIDPRTAFLASDRLNIAHGITTKAHAIAFEEAHAEHRSPDGAMELIGALSDCTGLLATNLVHARFELADVDPTMVRDVLRRERVVLTSLMNHAPGSGEYESVDDFHERYGTDAGLSSATVDMLANTRSRVDDEWSEIASEIVSCATAEGIPIASHDDATREAVERAARHGIDICEFPLTREAAATAASLGMTTVMGAPNLVRGESLFDNLCAKRAIEMGVVDVLCADYHPPSLLHSIFVDTGEPLHERVARVTEAPARLLGLADRGRIAAGARADLVVVDPEPHPQPTDVIVGGSSVMRPTPE